MVIYVTTDDSGRIISWSTSPEDDDIEVEVDRESAFLMDNPFHYELVGSELVKWKTEKEIQDELKEEEERQEVENELTRRQGVAKVLLEQELAKQFLLSEDIPQSEKNYFVSLFPEWVIGEDLLVGQKVAYNGVVYEVIQRHTTQGDWKPKDVPALFKMIFQKETSEGVEVIPDFETPTAVQNYAKGDKVRFEGKIYRSLVDNNVWSPSGYPPNWEEII